MTPQQPSEAPDRRSWIVEARARLAAPPPRLVEERAVVYDGVRRTLRIYHVGGRQIWGVTARILHSLLERLGLEGPAEP